MDRNDPELGPVRRCRRCREWWPLEGTFYEAFRPGYRLRTCNACLAERREAGKRVRIRTDLERQADTLRHARRRNDPAYRAILCLAARRYYQRNAERIKAARRARYAAQKAAA